MTNMKAAGPENEVIHYQPKHLIEGDAAEFKDPSARKAERQSVYRAVDALYHFFEREHVADECAIKEDDSAEEDRDLFHAEAIVKLMNDDFSGVDGRIEDACHLRTEVNFAQFRDGSVFIGGDLTRGHLPQIRRWCYKHFRNAIYLDAQGYSDEHGVGEETSAFEQLMDLAGRTKEVIDDGVCKMWPTDSKAVMRFINAYQTDTVGSSDRIYAEDEQVETKWMIEGKFLADELIGIPGFQQNFDKVVIFGAMRYILAGDLNLNKLYRLFAKLGRINTRLFFVG